MRITSFPPVIGFGFHFPPNVILYVKFGMIGKMLNFFQRPATLSHDRLWALWRLVRL